jgi:hypothetical protein
MKKEQYRAKITWDDYYKRWNVSSQTYAAHTYAVTVQRIDDSLVCNCPWGRGQARKTGNPCKHVTAVEKWLEALPEKERMWYL